MKLKLITFALLFGLWTAFTLGGSIWGFLFLAGPNSVARLNVISSGNMIALAIGALFVYLCGGGLWGLGIARLMSADGKAIIRACALSWTATVFTFSTALGLSLGPIFQMINKVLPKSSHSTHYYFLSIFVVVIGIVTSINGYVVTGKLGFNELKTTAGLDTGVAAALGFLAVGLILLYGFGWEVGHPVPGKYGMLKLALFCSIGAALAGGMALGWILREAKNRSLSS